MNDEKKNQYDSRELFRYVKIERPQVVDIQLRAKRFKPLNTILKKTKQEQEKWARILERSGKLTNKMADLKFDYFPHLNIEELDAHFLPTRKDIKEKKSFKSLSIVKDADYRADYEACLTSLIAYRALKKQDELAEATKLFNFVDNFSRLDRTEKRKPYAAPVFEKIEFKTPKEAKQKPDTDVAKKEREKLNDLKTLSNNLRLLWGAKNELVKAGTEEYEKSVRDVKALRFDKTKLPKGAKKYVGAGKKKKLSAAQKRLDKANSKAYATFLKERNVKLANLRERHKDELKLGSLVDVVSADAQKMAKHMPNMNGAKVMDLQKETSGFLAQYNVPFNKMCNAYSSVVSQIDNSPETERPFLWPNCFKENPDIAIRDEIRLLGRGDLIKVEETFIGYRPGEISYIENILAGEVRKREVKSSKYFEQVRENIEEETTDVTEESSSKSKQDLESEIENEINTRFNSDINASASGSGGGTMGKVQGQIFDWIEDKIQDGAKLHVGGNIFEYPATEGLRKGVVVGLANGKRHIITPHGKSHLGMKSSDQIAPELGRSELLADSKELDYLADFISNANIVNMGKSSAEIDFVVAELIKGISPI